MKLSVQTPMCGLVQLHAVPFTGYVASAFLAGWPEPVRYNACRDWLRAEGYLDVLEGSFVRQLEAAGIGEREFAQTLNWLAHLESAQ